MKILHIISGLADGGAEAVLYRLVRHDPDDMHHVVSLTGEGKYSELLLQMGAHVTALGMPRGRVTLQGLMRLWRLTRNWRPDVVQTWMYHADLVGGIVGRLAGFPVVWGIHHSHLDRKKHPLSTILVAEVCARLSKIIPARIVACAQAASEAHAALGYDTKRTVIIPNGYDLARFTPDPAGRERLRRELGVPQNVPLLGMVARFDPNKDHANLLEALAKLKHCDVAFRAVLVGAGLDAGNEELRRFISAADLGEDILLLGSRVDIPAVMSALDIHVLSSSSEAFPNVLAEAMACGTPCVSTDVGDAALIVDATGWVVPPRDTDALAAALSSALVLLRDPALWAQRQEKCRQRIADQFSIETMVQRYRDVWKEKVHMEYHL